MLLNELLKTYRRARGLTQGELAARLLVTTQAVSKWETGKAVPSIDNLLALSDFYNVSLDELVQGSPFFKKPYLVGRRFNWRRGSGLALFWLFVSLLFTGFGYQPWWLFGLVFGLGLVVVVPVAVNDYWLITRTSVVCYHYSDRVLMKFWQLIANRPIRTTIPYSRLKAVQLSYRTRRRFSPFDFNPDNFQLILITATATRVVDFNAQVRSYLPQFSHFLQRQGVTVIDDQQLLPLIVSGQSLYDHFHDPVNLNNDHD